MPQNILYALAHWSQGHNILSSPEMALKKESEPVAAKIEKTIIYIHELGEQRPRAIARCLGPDAHKNAPLVAAAPALLNALARATTLLNSGPEAQYLRSDIKQQISEWQQLIERATSGMN